MYLTLELLASECFIPSGGALIGKHLQGLKAVKTVNSTWGKDDVEGP